MSISGSNGAARSPHQVDAQGTVAGMGSPGDAVEEDFHRGLKERHIQMIAIGGAIGVGLFLGSAKAIQQAGSFARCCRMRSPAS